MIVEMIEDVSEEAVSREETTREEKSLLEKLEELLKSMNPWEKKPILKAGRIIIELVKLPERKTKTTIEPERLVIHIRREDAFRGLFIKDPEELEDLQAAITTQKIKEVLQALEQLEKKRKIQEYEL